MTELAGLVNLRIQKMHLDTTLESIGLQDPTPQELQDCLVSKFPDSHSELLFIIRQMDNLTATLMENLMVDINRRPRWTDEPPERASFEWRRVKRSFSTRKRDKILSDLRNWNDDLKNLIEKTEIPADDGSAAVEKVKLRYNRHTCDSIRESLQSLHRAVQGAICCTKAPHQATLTLDWLGTRLKSSEVPKFTVSLLHGSDPTPKSPWRSFHAASEGDESSPGDSTTSLLSTTPSPPSTRSPSPALKSKVTRIFSKPRKSVTLAPPKGSPAKGKSFSLSHVSNNYPRVIRAIGLKTMLTLEPEQEKSFSPSLSAKQRYSLAASLAQAVLYLSDSPWLNNRWENEQVKLFIHKNSSGCNELLDHPHISYLFGSLKSPPSSPTSEAVDEAFQGMMRRIPNGFIFALGILLVELAINEVFQKSSLEAILHGDFLTLRRKLDEVYREAGSLYGNAAQSSHFDFGLPMFRQQFHHTVVAPLQATHELFSALYSAS
ncbi:hypothetical protein ACO1O0_007626 [Amphichorda felina]